MVALAYAFATDTRGGRCDGSGFVAKLAHRQVCGNIVDGPSDQTSIGTVWTKVLDPETALEVCGDVVILAVSIHRTFQIIHRRRRRMHTSARWFSISTVVPIHWHDFSAVVGHRIL